MVTLRAGVTDPLTGRRYLCGDSEQTVPPCTDDARVVPAARTARCRALFPAGGTRGTRLPPTGPRE